MPKLYRTTNAAAARRGRGAKSTDARQHLKSHSHSRTDGRTNGRRQCMWEHRRSDDANTRQPSQNKGISHRNTQTRAGGSPGWLAGGGSGKATPLEGRVLGSRECTCIHKEWWRECGPLSWRGSGGNNEVVAVRRKQEDKIKPWGLQDGRCHLLGPAARLNQRQAWRSANRSFSLGRAENDCYYWCTVWCNYEGFTLAVPPASGRRPNCGNYSKQKWRWEFHYNSSWIIFQFLFQEKRRQIMFEEPPVALVCIWPDRQLAKANH